MKVLEVTQILGLEEKHYNLESLKVPVIEPGLYNTLGRKLFDFYQNYSVSKADQREIESICFLLTSFVLQREKPRSPIRSFLKRFKRW